uniref:Gypsy retrotransposon integrase-like protein 1 n=1 Tax=Laticauda laticaudata TaxID=8630 RepID=A0A8C5T014_LATLA
MCIYITKIYKHRTKHMETPVRRATRMGVWIKTNNTSCLYKDGLYWKGDKIYIPSSYRKKIVSQCHDVRQAGHFGFLKTLHLVWWQFWWPHMRSEIEHYIKECHICATAKPRVRKPLGLLQIISDPNRPWQDIAMDFIVELPSRNRYIVIWIIIDLFSKQAHFIPCKGLPSATKLANLFIKHVYRLHGTPRRIILDRVFVHLLGSSQGLSSAYHPSTNSAAERANAMIERYLRLYISYQQQEWADLLPFAEVAYNNAIHESTGYSLLQVANGIEFVTMKNQRSAADWCT